MPARRPAFGSGTFEGYVAVAAYYVDLLRGPDDGSALGANVLDAAVLAGAASATLYGDRRFFALIVIIVALYLDSVFRIFLQASAVCFSRNSP